MLRFAVIGLGNRGSVYSDLIVKHDDVKITSVCDPDYNSLRQARELYGVEEKDLFVDEEEFFKEKRADILIVSTLDKLHKRHTIKGMEMGYDVLLEKPIAPTAKDCEEIFKASKKYDREVVICHNLRYAPFFQLIKKEIMDGKIGKVLSIEHSENVAYWHYMCSFIRGKWHLKEETSPIILAKTCHDLDLITWYIGNLDSKVNSYGSLSYYTKSNPKKRKSDMCVKCMDKDCIYNSLEFFMKEPNALCTPYGFEKTYENIKRYLSDENNDYGKCVFEMNNDVCDRQIVDISYQDGITANLLVHGFEPKDTNRLLRIYGDKGYISGDFNSGMIEIRLEDGNVEKIDVSKLSVGSHNGGDYNLISDYIDYKKSGVRPIGISRIEDSLKSHYLAFEAEESRIENEARTIAMSDLSMDHETSDEEYLRTEKIGEIQIGTITILDSEKSLKSAVKHRLKAMVNIFKSGIKKYNINIKTEPFKHGFISIYLNNNSIIRVSINSSDTSRIDEMKIYGTNGSITYDFINKTLTYQSAIYFSEAKTIEGYDLNLTEEENAIVEEIVNKM